MNPAAAGVQYRVPPEPSRLPSITLAAVVHAGLLLFLWAGVSWQNTATAPVEAEVWDMKVQAAAAPPIPEPVVQPQPEPTPKVEQPPVEEKVEAPPPEINLEKQKKLEKLKKEKALKEELAEKKRLEKEEADKKLAEKKEKAKKLAEEQKKLEKLRDAEMRRITGAVGTTGEAAKSTAPRIDSGYLASITSKIKSTTTYLGNTDVPGNPRAQFRIEELPTGEIISVKMIKSSGVPAFDQAVEKGILKSSPLPKKKDGTVERTLDIGFSMKDLD
jgi:colicin import membrane protein